jgi:Tol biopolymer transport system component
MTKRGIVFIGFVLSLWLSSCGQSDIGEIASVSFVVSIPDASVIKWSPDGESLAISSGNTFRQQSSLYLYHFATKKITPIMEDQDGFMTADSWSPDNQYLAISISGPSSRKSGIWILNLRNSSDFGFLTDGRDASWSNTGLIVIRHELNNLTPSLFLVSPYSTDTKFLFNPGESLLVNSPSWSYRGNEFVFVINERGSSSHGDLFLFEIDSMESAQLTLDGENLYPAWSPVNDLIAYTKYDAEGLQTNLYLLDVDSMCEIKIFDISQVGSPTWSPDGRQIAFLKGDSIYVIDLEETYGDDFLETGIVCQE